jgi:hypothetical protein
MLNRLIAEEVKMFLSEIGSSGEIFILFSGNEENTKIREGNSIYLEWPKKGLFAVVSKEPLNILVAGILLMQWLLRLHP